MRLETPSSSDQPTRASFSIMNLGGAAGTVIAAMKADGKVVASEELTLGPGEHRAVALEAHLAEDGAHEIQVGDFPVWPFSTYRNVPGSVELYRDRIALTGGGARNAFNEYAAIYFNDVEGDFDLVGENAQPSAADWQLFRDWADHSERDE